MVNRHILWVTTALATLVAALIPCYSASVEGAAGRLQGSRTRPRPSAANAAAFPSPATVIRSLYKVHNKGYGPVFDKKGKKHLDQYFDAHLAKLIWKNLVGPPSGEVGNLDFDPLYFAQDFSVTEFVIGAPRVQRSDAASTVTFKNFDRRERLVFHLRKTNTGWRIKNIDYGGGENLVKILSRPF